MAGVFSRFFGQAGAVGTPSPIGAGSLGVPSSGQSNAPVSGGALDPNSRAGNVADGVPYQLVPVYPPFVRIANDPSIVYFPRLRSASFNTAGAALGFDGTLTMFASAPTIIIARSAAAITTTGAALVLGRESLDTFQAQMFRAGSSTDLFDAGWGGANPSQLVIGSSIFGTASQPMLIPGNGFFVDTGGQVSVRVATLVDAIRVDVTLWCIEEYGPSR